MNTLNSLIDNGKLMSQSVLSNENHMLELKGNL